MKKVVLVTGASSGIGLAIANLLHTKNYKVYGASRNMMKKEVLFQKIEMDLTKKNDIDVAVSSILSKEKKIDVLINAAGYAQYGAFVNMSYEEIEAQFNTNFFGALFITQCVIKRAMIPNKSGVICSIGSIGGHIGLPYQGIYSATKFALQGFTEAIRHEVKQFNINMVVVNPGDVSTNISINRKFSKGKMYSDEAYQHSLKTLKVIENDEKNGIAPEKIAYKVLKIIKNTKTKSSFIKGPFIQECSVYIKKILPQKWFEKIIQTYYAVGVSTND